MGGEKPNVNCPWTWQAGGTTRGKARPLALQLKFRGRSVNGLAALSTANNASILSWFLERLQLCFGRLGGCNLLIHPEMKTFF